MQQPHQNFHGHNCIQDFPPQYVIQNDPPRQDGCCGGRSEQYNTAGGVSTGIMHLVIGVLSIALSGATYAFPNAIYSPYGIWSGIVFYIPAGIFGVLSKNKRTGLITGYLVMGILSTLEAFVMLVMAAVWSRFYSIDISCNQCNHSWIFGWCDLCRSTESTTIHAVLAVVAFIEFIVSIVGAAYCCGGLRCCCASPSPAMTTIQLQNQPQQVALPPPYSAQGPFSVEISEAYYK